jgi:hypothetical protein
MKRLLALLLLLSSAALHAQQLDWTNAVNVPNIVVNPSMDNCVSGPSTCGAWKEGGSTLGNWVGANSNGGAVDPGGKQYTFSYMSGMLYQDIDLSQYNTNLFNFTFMFDLNNSCRNFIGGACDRIDGPIDEFSATLKFYDTNGLNNQFTFLSGNPSTATIGCVGGVEILGICLLGQNVQDAWQSFGWYSHVQSNALFTSARLEFTGRDVGFWGGLYGPSVDNAALQINYMPPPYPLSGGGAGMNVAAPGSDYIFIYKGNDPVLFSQLAILGTDLVGWTALTEGGSNLTITSIERPDPDYLFLYTDGIPVNGSWYSFQEVAPVTTVDCALSPFDPTCVIDTLGIDDGTVDYTDPEQVLASLEDDTTDTTDTGADDGSSDGTEVIEEEETLVADEEATDEEVSLEEMLQEEEATDEEDAVVVADEETETVSEPAVVATYRELTDEEKAAILADAISKNTLEGALAIASETLSSSSSAAATTTTQSDSTSRSSTTQAAVAATVTESSTTIEMKVEEEKTEVVVASDAGADVLETGRLIGKEALAATTTQSEQSASESITQAESIAISSSETQTVVAVSNETTQTTVTEDTTVVASSKVEEVEDGKREVQQVASEDTSSSSTAEIEQQIVAQSELNIEVDTSTVTSDNTSEQVVEDKAESVVVADTSTTEQTDTFAEIMQLDIKPVTEETGDKDVEFVQQLAAASIEQKQEETNNSGFSEDEKVTIVSDPALANAFNVAPNVTNLEVAGVLNNKQEEKSDAEKAADKVVAANAKEQEEINKNYMDADQSGIVAAMGADTDVASYRTAMIRDNNNWYKPEDIYKNIVIKDNVRGSYFLEKGNTDTYKKMIEEQYK